MKFIYPQGATPLNADCAAQLIPSHITIQQQLNEWEATNIQEARKWAFLQRRIKNVLDIRFIKILHKKMFDKTWLWAGQWRTHQTNIGVESYRIIAELGQLLDDIQFYIDEGIYDFEETAARLNRLSGNWLICIACSAKVKAGQCNAASSIKNLNLFLTRPCYIITIDQFSGHKNDKPSQAKPSQAKPS